MTMQIPSHQNMTSQSPMYIYATEMVSKYYSKLNLKDKRVLSITGSGDQIINAYFFGADEVIGFDINKYAAFMLELKVSAILRLSYAEFIKFFGKDMGNGTLEFSLYSKLKDNLSSDARRFFNKLYKDYNNNGKKLIKSSRFRQRSMINSSAAEINIYLRSKRNYLKCRSILQNKKPQSLELDINNIAVDKKLQGKFDIINLSNVINYFTGNVERDQVLKVLLNATKNISKRLKKDGIFFYYSYSPRLYYSGERQTPPASQLRMIDQIKTINNFQVVLKRFTGVNQLTQDRINIFGK